MSINTTNVNTPIKDKKKDLFEQIEIVKTFCFNYPTVNVGFSFPSFNADFDVIEFLLDLITTILGKKAEELQREIVKWLVDNIEPLELNLRFTIKDLIKSCYICKINPRIPPWMFVNDPTDPTGNTPGIGINIEIDQIDFDCMLKVNPRSPAGRTLYSGPADMNQFLYDVIQSNGSKIWNDPVTGKPIAQFTYLKSGYVSSSNGPGTPQNKELRNNIINMKIRNEYNANDKSIVDFINDYLNSFIMFDAAKMMTQAVDLIFGVVTQKIKLDTECIEKKIEFETTINKMVKCGLDDPNTQIDNSFFQFSTDEVVNIKEQARNRKNGIKVYKDCENLESSIDFDTVLEINDQLSGATDDKAKQVDIIETGLNTMAQTSTNNMTKDTDKNEGKFTFLEELIKAFKLVIMRLTVSPKNMYLFASLEYIVNGQARYSGPTEWMENLLCILRELLSKLLEELGKFLLIQVLKGLKILIIKYIQRKIEEKLDTYKKQKLSLLPDVLGCSGISDSFSNPAAIANTAVDAGFDQAENAIQKKL